MIKDTCHQTVIGTIIVSFSLASRPKLLDVLLGDAQLHRLIPARRLGRLGRLANALGRGSLDDHDRGAGPRSPVELLVLGATAGTADCP